MKTVTTLLAIAALFACQALEAGERPHNGASRSLVVGYADLNLAHPSGIDTLYGRLQQAARSVCGRTGDIRSAEDMGGWKACLAEAMDQAVEAVGSPALARVHASRTGRTLDPAGEQVAAALRP